MPVRLKVEVTGFKDTLSALRAQGKLAKDHRDFLNDVIEPWLKREFERAFRTRGFGQWPRLAPATVLERIAEGFSATPLIKTGNYYQQTLNLRGRRTRRNVLEIRSPVRYAAALEFGTRHSPARPVFKPVAERLQRKIEGLWRAYHARQSRTLAN